MENFGMVSPRKSARLSRGQGILTGPQDMILNLSGNLEVADREYREPGRGELTDATN